MAEADDATDADQEVQAEGGEREAQHLDCDLDRVGVADERQREQYRSQPRDDDVLGAPEALQPHDALRQHDAGLARLGLAHQAPGPHHEHHRHEQEHQHQRDLGKDQDAEGLQLGDQQCRQECAWHRAHAAHHRDDEGLGDDGDVHVRVGGELGRLQRAAKPGQRRAEEQRAGEQQRLVDAERAHHLAILRRRPYQHAEARLVHEQPQEAQHQRSHRDQEQLVGREAVSQDVERTTQPRRARAQDIERAPDLEHQVLHDQDDAEGGEQLEQLRHLVDPSQQHELHRHADQPDADGGRQHGGEEHRKAAGDVEQARDERDAEVGAQHVERAMCEIDDARDAEHDRQPRRNDEQRRGAGEPVQRLHEEEGQIRQAHCSSPSPHFFNGERVGVRGGTLFRRLRSWPPLTLALSP